MKHKMFIWPSICTLIALGIVLLPVGAQRPGPPAGTEGMIFVVLDFEVAAGLGKPLTTGSDVGNEWALLLEHKGAPTKLKVLRKAVAFSETELRDPRRTRMLKEELGAQVVIGGKLEESEKTLTVTSVWADKATELSTKTTEVAAVVVGINGHAYRAPEESFNSELPLRFGDLLLRGDRLRCGPDSTVVILVDQKLVTIKETDGWYTPKASTRTSLTSFQLIDSLFSESIRKYVIVSR